MNLDIYIHTSMSAKVYVEYDEEKDVYVFQ